MGIESRKLISRIFSFSLHVPEALPKGIPPGPDQPLSLSGPLLGCAEAGL